jgi:hypothetical protein
LQPTGILTSSSTSNIDISSIPRSSLRSPRRGLDTKIGEAKEDRQHHNITITGANKAISWNHHFYRFSYFPGRGWRSFLFSYIIISLLLSGGVLTVWSTHIDFLGFPLFSGAGKAIPKGRCFFFSFFQTFAIFLLLFLSAFYFRFPTGDLHHEINDVCVRQRKRGVETGS